MAEAIIPHALFSNLLTLEKAAAAAGLHPQLVVRLVEFGLVEPAGGEGENLFFRPEVVPRLRAIARLRYQMGVNLPGIALVLELREEIVRLREELARWRRING